MSSLIRRTGKNSGKRQDRQDRQEGLMNEAGVSWGWVVVMQRGGVKAKKSHGTTAA